MRHFAVIEAPSVLGLRTTGVEELPNALLRKGLAERLSARHAERVEPQAYSTLRESETLMLNPRSIAEYSTRPADAVGRIKPQSRILLLPRCKMPLCRSRALGRYRRPSCRSPPAAVRANSALRNVPPSPSSCPLVRAPEDHACRS